MKTLLTLQTQMQQYEPKPNNYMFKHTYEAAKEVYDNCVRVINEALYAEGEQFYDRECFDQVLQDIESGKGLKPIGTNTTGLRKEN